MIVRHTGREPPTLKRRFDPDAKDWVAAIWNDIPAGYSIQTSTWVVPAGWTKVSEETDVGVTVDGTSYPNANRVKLTVDTSVFTGQVALITNRVTLSNGSDTIEEDRSARVVVGEL